MKKRIFLLSLFCIACLSMSYDTNADSYVLDKGHTHIGFDVERFLVGEVSGRFNDFRATIHMDGEDYSSLQLRAIIQVNSLDSNNSVRDGHLKGEIWLDAANHPEILFTSTQLVQNENKTYAMQGDFTIRGVTQKVEFPVEILGPFKDPTQKTAVGIKANFTIDRFDYGIAFNRKMDNGGFFIGKDVHIKIRALAYKN